MYALNVIYWLPMLAVGISGLVLVARKRPALPPRTVTLAMLGCVLILLSTVLQAAWLISIVYLYRIESQIYGALAAVEGIVTLALSAGGFGCLIGAVLARAPEPVQPWQAAGPYYPGPQPPVIK